MTSARARCPAAWGAAESRAAQRIWRDWRNTSMRKGHPGPVLAGYRQTRPSCLSTAVRPVIVAEISAGIGVVAAEVRAAVGSVVHMPPMPLARRVFILMRVVSDSLVRLGALMRGLVVLGRVGFASVRFGCI
jgi:hypothetical protein